MTTPALVHYAASDAVVDIAALHQVRQFLPAADYAAIPHAAHELLRERDDPRHDCLHRIGNFLAARTCGRGTVKLTELWFVSDQIRHVQPTLAARHAKY